MAGWQDVQAAAARGGGWQNQNAIAQLRERQALDQNDPSRQLQMLQIMGQIKNAQNEAQLQNLKMQQYIRGQQDDAAAARAFSSMLVPGAMGDAPQAPYPGQASQPMNPPIQQGGSFMSQPAGFSGAAPGTQQGMAQQAMAGIMQPQPQQQQQQPMIAPVPRAAAQGFMNDPKVMNMIAYARNARLSPGAIQKAVMDYFPIWQAEQSSRQKAETSDMLSSYRNEMMNMRDRALDLRQGALQGSWAGAPDDIEINPLGLDKDEWLKTLPAGLVSDMQAISDYATKPPSASEMKSNPGLQKTMRAVKTMNPDFKGISGYNVMQSFKSPDKPTGKAMNAFDTAIQHLDVVDEAAKELQNGTFKPTNAIAQKIASITGEAAPDSFDAVRQFVTNEVLRAASGNALALADREELSSALNKTQSPAQMAAVLSKFRQLMGGRLLSYREQYHNGTGRNDFGELLSPRTREVFGGILGEKGGGGGSAAPAGGGGIQFLGFE